MHMFAWQEEASIDLKEVVAAQISTLPGRTDTHLARRALAVLCTYWVRLHGFVNSVLRYRPLYGTV